MRCQLKWPQEANFKSAFVVQITIWEGNFLFSLFVFKPYSFLMLTEAKIPAFYNNNINDSVSPSVRAKDQQSP